jgi:glutamate racemase
MDNRPIGIFDSGVGGLSILLEIQKLLPQETAIFVADQSFVPYGGKTKEQLLERVTKIIEFLRKKDVKAVVMACNTATVYTIDEMRQKFQMPIIGTVPVIKTIASISKTKKAAVFSTPATAKSFYLDGLIDKFAGGVEVTKVGGTGLEELVEEGELNSPEINAILKEELSPLVAGGIDAIALGCTHYPFLRANIETIVGKGITVVDSGGAVARRLKEVLTNNTELSERKDRDEYYTTGEAEKFQRVAEKLMNAKLPSAVHIDL